MEAQQFLAEFGYISNALGGIGKLRELVIQLAISGRLVERIESEAPVSQAIEAAADLRRTYEADLGLRATRMQPPLRLRPFSVPGHWQWTRLEQICLYIQRGKGPKYADNSSTHVISQKCVQWSGFDLSSARFVADESLNSYGKERFLCTGDLLWNSTGTGTAGRVAIYQPEENITAVADSHITVVRLANCSPRYLWCVIASPWVQSRIEPSHSDSLVSGTTQQVELNTSTARALPIPLPPIEEQSRIVDKVDELMALCDKLEERQKVRRKLQNNLRQSTLEAVAGATSPHELKTTWSRLADSFGWLFHVPADVEAFKGLILDLAVSGHLSDIEQRHASTGAELIDAIAARRIAWSKECVGQEQKEALAMLKKLRTQQVNVPEAPLPEHWIWASLLQVSQAVVDCHNKTAPYVSHGIHLIRTTDIRNGRMDLANTRKISEETYAYWARRMPPKSGDIFFTREAPMGEAAIVPEGEKVCLGQRSMLIRLFPELLSNRYLLYVIQSPSFQSRMVEAAIGMTVKHLRVGGVEDLVVPVPPKPEQDRVVAIIDALFHVCDRFEGQLSNKQRTATNLASSAVADLTGIAIEQEEQSMKVPHTELIASLRLGTAPGIKAQAPLATILARHNGEMSAKDLWQRFGGEIDAFYAQLKSEVEHGWILEPAVAEMREKQPDMVSA
ncbi:MULTISPECIES: restriction endonuclease subunit S [Pseudomonas]|uniref:restriction endonuclease subunit S n=1 Tax=Pseudomonas TaxID=286 RepID=UPI0008772876|nr:MULTISPECIES: restriction endonuclease subunit S [Pseudomonas]SCZ25564.1 type I restriction enzyme, S subunit [Pseudomonas sp. NFIX46]SDB64066.1 type I restriction enzyme, S subunit [Pseudomonas putida]SFQ80093.1 type I restriction enzyme, S subunit [Pseudomonas sp. NFIX49]